jgi:hypothetical protein
MLQSLLLGGLVPALIAFAVVAAARRWMPGHVAGRHAIGVAAASAFFLGYVLLPAWAPLKPASAWQWIPYLSLLASLAGSWMLWGGVPFALSLAAAWFLVPTWPDLQPSRPVYIALLTGYLLLLIVLLRALAARISVRLQWMMLSISSLTLAVLLAKDISLLFGHLAGIAAAAMIGVSLACARHQEATSQALLPVYAILIGGLAFVGYLQPEPPAYALMLVPAAPLAAWIMVVAPLARLGSRLRGAVGLAAVFALLAAAAVWLWWQISAAG